MRKNIVIGSLSVVMLALCVLSVHLQRNVNRLTAAAANVARANTARPGEAWTPPVPATPVPGESAPALGEDERAAYEKQIAALRARLAAATVEQSEQTQHSPELEQKKKSPMNGLADMLKAPGMKDVIRAQQKATMDMTYASLYEYLDLPEDRMAAFKDLLLERQMALMDAGLDMMDTSLPTDERKAKSTASAAMKKTFDEKIHDFLGEEDADVYDQFEATQPERTQVHFFKQALAGTEPLTETQEHDLITGMHAERETFRFSTDFEDPVNMDGRAFTDETIAQHMEELDRLQERYTSRAAEVLSESQLKQFKNSQKQHRAMQEMGLKMAGQMFAK